MPYPRIYQETKEKLAATTNALSLDANTDCSKTLISDNEIDTTADDDEIDVLSTLDFADSMMPPVGGGDLPRPPRTHNEALRVLLRSYYVAGYNMGMMRVSRVSSPWGPPRRRGAHSTPTPGARYTYVQCNLQCNV